MEEAVIKKRVDALLASREEPTIYSVQKLLQGALALMIAVYGHESEQITTLQEHVNSRAGNAPFFHKSQYNAIRGALENLRDEIEAGMIGSLQKRMTGEVLTDFIQLTRAALDQNRGDGKNVAAVLAAAAFEDTIRRMGATLAGVIGRDDLEKIINTLKEKGVLQSPQLGIAQSYLSFRNHALHANWEKIEKEAVVSVLGFVEQLLLKHFQ